MTCPAWHRLLLIGPSRTVHARQATPHSFSTKRLVSEHAPTTFRSKACVCACSKMRASWQRRCHAVLKPIRKAGPHSRRVINTPSPLFLQAVLIWSTCFGGIHTPWHFRHQRNHVDAANQGTWCLLGFRRRACEGRVEANCTLMVGTCRGHLGSSSSVWLSLLFTSGDLHSEHLHWRHSRSGTECRC